MVNNGNVRIKKSCINSDFAFDTLTKKMARSKIILQFIIIQEKIDSWSKILYEKKPISLSEMGFYFTQANELPVYRYIQNTIFYFQSQPVYGYKHYLSLLP